MLRFVVFLFAVSLLAAPSFAQSPVSFNADAPLELAWQGNSVGPCAGCSGILVADLDGDGIDEIVFAERHRRLFILEETPDGIFITWTSPRYGFDEVVGYEVSIVDFDLIRDDSGDRTLLYVLLSGGRVDVYDGASRELIESHYTGVPFPYTAGVGKVGDRRVMAIAATNPSHVTVYDASTFEKLVRLEDVFAEHIEFGDVTGDGRANIVLSNTQYLRGGIVLNGESFDIEWDREETFGHRFRLVDTSGDGTMEILALHRPGVFEAVSAQTREVHWSVDFGLPFYTPIGAFDLWDVTGDGALDLVVPLSEPTGNQIISLTDGSFIDTWPGQLRLDGVPQIALVDLSEEDDPVVVHSTATSLRVSSFSDDSTIWESHFEGGPFSIDLLSADTRGAGGVIVASSSFYDTPGRLTVRVPSAVAVDRQLEFTTADSERHVALTYSGDRDDPVIVVADGSEMHALSYATLDTIWSHRVANNITSLAVADVDGDAIPEVVATTQLNAAYIFSLEGTQMWHRSLIGTIAGAHIADCGLASSPDLFFYGQGRLIHYDGKTREPLGIVANLPLIRAIDSGDLLADGRTVIAMGHDDGRISLVDCETRAVETLDGLQPDAVHGVGVIHGLRLVNVDASPELEILVGTDRLHVFDGQTLQERWRSDLLGDGVGYRNSLQAADLLGDGFTDIFVGTDQDVFHFVTSVQTHAEVDVATEVLPTQTVSKLGAFPNPFNDSVTLRVETAVAGAASLEIYDILGRKIATLLSATLPVGVTDVIWEGDSLPSGIYFARMSLGGETLTMSVVKR